MGFQSACLHRSAKHSLYLEPQISALVYESLFCKPRAYSDHPNLDILKAPMLFPKSSFKYYISILKARSVKHTGPVHISFCDYLLFLVPRAVGSAFRVSQDGSHQTITKPNFKPDRNSCKTSFQALAHKPSHSYLHTIKTVLLNAHNAS